jgi:Transposase IS116/IS110/IS902 family
MGQLLLGAPRRRGGALPSQAERDRGRAVPRGEIYLSFPGLGDRLAARIAGEIGDHPEQFQTPNSLQCYAGQAPVTRRSGKRELLITRRLACNRHLADAIHKWAFASLRRSIWAKDYYDSQRDRGKDHHAALRALGNRWLEILWHCLQRQVPYDEAVTSPTAPGPCTQPPDPPAVPGWGRVPARWPGRGCRLRCTMDGGAGGGGNGTDALVEDRGRPQRL